jgi:hypothetical protein
LNSGLYACRAAFTTQALYSLNHTSRVFCYGYFRDGVFQTIWRGESLLISASQVARITGMSHRCQA